jgi:hypothetical protein
MMIKKRLRGLFNVLPKSLPNESASDSAPTGAVQKEEQRLSAPPVVNALMHLAVSMFRQPASGKVSPEGQSGQKGISHRARLSLDAFDLCAMASNLLKIRLTIVADPLLPPKAKGFLYRLQEKTFLLFYRPSTSPISVNLSILHELSHLLLNHRPTLLRKISARCIYSYAQEREAEQLAVQLLAFLVQQVLIQTRINDGETMNETDPASQRFASVMPRKLKNRD